MTKEITAALCNFLKEVPSLSTLSTARIQTKNGKGFEFDFAELGYICNVVNPVLAKNGLHIYHADEIIDGKEVLASTIYHISGESLPTSRKFIPKGINPNPLYEYGSAKTYFRRYVTLGMLNLWHGVDDAGLAYEQQENKTSETNMQYQGKQLDSALSEDERQQWIDQLNKIFNDDRSKFDEINDKFKNHFAVTKMSDAIQEQKHIEYIISIINKKEVA